MIRVGLQFYDVVGDQSSPVVMTIVSMGEWTVYAKSPDNILKGYLRPDIHRLVRRDGLPNPTEEDAELARQDDIIGRIALIAVDLSRPVDERVEDIKNLAYIL